MTKENLKHEIKDVVLSSIRNYIKNYNNKKKPTFHPLDYLISKERKIRSIVGGIETSMGRTLWEPLAKRIASLNDFVVMERQLRKPKDDLAYLTRIIDNIKSDRRSIDPILSTRDINSTIKEACQQFKDSNLHLIKTTVGQGVDIWLKKDGLNYLFDTKTVQPNLDKFNELFNQLLNWYGYFYTENPLESVECRIVFPYNPYGKDNFWENSKGKGKPLKPISDAFVGNEFWDFISGQEHTLEMIFDAFKDVESKKTLELDFLKLFK